MPEHNVGLGHAVMRQVIAHPEQHDQGSFFSSATVAEYAATAEVRAWAQSGDHLDCGTTACVAGWTTLLHGDRVLNHMVVQPIEGGQSIWADVRAAELLGLTNNEAWHLFYECQRKDTALAYMVELFGPLPEDDTKPNTEDDPR
jgi:hypothetical protein